MVDIVVCLPVILLEIDTTDRTLEGSYVYAGAQRKGLSYAEELFASVVVHAFGLTW